MYTHVVPEDQAVLKNFVREVKEGKATSLRKEVRVCRENGKYTWTSINVMVRDCLLYTSPGYLADFVSLDADIFTVPAEQIKAIRPVATYLGGRAVYQR